VRLRISGGHYGPAGNNEAVARKFDATGGADHIDLPFIGCPHVRLHDAPKPAPGEPAFPHVQPFSSEVLSGAFDKI
jgi:hypothetical protein